jgi:putative tryptophan/tyrosine transport system substrate-binding protein
VKRLAVAFLTLALLATPLAAEAQEAGKGPRVALFSIDLIPERIAAFREGLRQLGYVEGRNIAIESQSAAGKSERLPSLAVGLVGRKIDVIVAAGAEAIRASQQATQTIPIVMVLGGNPVVSGFIASLPRPGGNVTGLAATLEGLSAKRLQLINDTVPQVARGAILWHPANPSHQLFLKEIEEAASSLGVQLYAADVRTPAELERAVSAMTTSGVGAVLVLGDNMFEDQRSRIVQLLARSKLPTIHFARIFVEAGGLMSYAPDQNDVYRRAATFVEKILKGVKPADLPVEQPTKSELVINLKTAKALGLTIPSSVLLRADEVIQ